MLLPDPELVAIRCELLQHDLALLEAVEHHIGSMAAREIALLAQTPYSIWTKLEGLSPIQVAGLAAAMGDPAHYGYACQVFCRSGLTSGRDDSGVRQRKGKGKRVDKTGDVYLRRALINAVATLLVHQPILGRYTCTARKCMCYHQLKQTKPAGVARADTARRPTGILWATLRDQRPATLILKRGVTM